MHRSEQTVCGASHLTVLRHISAERPPTTIARWYGGHADVPSVAIFSSMKAANDAGLRSAFVCWKRNVLLAEPPPLAMKWKLYVEPGCAITSTCAGRLFFVFASVNMSSGATCEYRRCVPVYVSKTPRERCISSSPSVQTYWPRFPITTAVPVSWQPGSTRPDAMFAFLSSSSATNWSLDEASGSLRMLESCCRWPGRSRCAMSVIAVADSSLSASGSTCRIFLPATSFVLT